MVCREARKLHRLTDPCPRHLGRQLEHIPAARGFDRSFSMLSAFHNHYAWEPQWERGNSYDDVSAEDERIQNLALTSCLVC